MGRYMIIFGELWDAPVCDDAIEVDTPVGVHCLRCDEPVIDVDQGFMFPMAAGGVEDRYITRWRPFNAPEDCVTTAMHRECFMADTMGHTVGVCSCTGWDSHSRAAAREVLRRVEAGALRQ